MPIADRFESNLWIPYNPTHGKENPHYSLQHAQAIVATNGLMAFTQTAIMDAAALGLSVDAACQVVRQLTRSMFYKSMTTHADSRCVPRALPKRQIGLHQADHHAERQSGHSIQGEMR